MFQRKQKCLSSENRTESEFKSSIMKEKNVRLAVLDIEILLSEVAML